MFIHVCCPVFMCPGAYCLPEEGYSTLQTTQRCCGQEVLLHMRPLGSFVFHVYPLLMAIFFRVLLLFRLINFFDGYWRHIFILLLDVSLSYFFIIIIYFHLFIYLIYMFVIYYPPCLTKLEWEKIRVVSAPCWIASGHILTAHAKRVRSHTAHFWILPFFLFLPRCVSNARSPVLQKATRWSNWMRYFFCFLSHNSTPLDVLKTLYVMHRVHIVFFFFSSGLRVPACTQRGTQSMVLCDSLLGLFL